MLQPRSHDLRQGFAPEAPPLVAAAGPRQDGLFMSLACNDELHNIAAGGPRETLPPLLRRGLKSADRAQNGLGQHRTQAQCFPGTLDHHSRLQITFFKDGFPQRSGHFQGCDT